VDWESGWDEYGEKGVADILISHLEDYNTISDLFKDYDHYCIDILQTLVILPFAMVERTGYIDNIPRGSR
jgi:hypothetical protein